MTVPTSGDAHVELLLGAYVLGALTAEEDRQVTAHLDVCERCRTVFLELSDTPALLSLATAADLAEGLEGLEGALRHDESGGPARG
ncbi:anti-sigma factor family protein [Streptomyces sp. NBC_01092]|uniref:anti-sigma factor family protein n=1 Tax=Streptomyces sp. NBC_01092 TaxID=2903748 RepID=UPI003864B29E|nr:zf-HC2 domain-containing protein [Streptomyces sp. NBC_01092]